MARKRHGGLGRGLDALIPQARQQEKEEHSEAGNNVETTESAQDTGFRKTIETAEAADKAAAAYMTGNAAAKEAAGASGNAGTVTASDAVSAADGRTKAVDPAGAAAGQTEAVSGLSETPARREEAGSGIRMSEADFQLVCQRLQEAEIRDVQFIGGEPFRHPQLREILVSAAKQFHRIEIFTNGTLLNDEWCALLKSLGIRLALSVYSDQEAMHNAVTGVRGSHRAVMRTIKLLRQYEIPYRTAAIAMKGIESPASADVVRLSGRGSLHLLTPDLLRKKLITKEHFTKPLDPARVQAAVSGNPCFSRKIYIAADLTVYPCVMERRIQHGNLRNAPLSGLLRQEILQWNRDRIPSCSICEYRYACAPCLPDACTDDPAAKPYFCTYDAEKGIWNDPAAQIAAILGGTT